MNNKMSNEFTNKVSNINQNAFCFECQWSQKSSLGLTLASDAKTLHFVYTASILVYTSMRCFIHLNKCCLWL